jgi:S1-C subfamily serine protease
MRQHPALAANVFGRGIAFDPSAPQPTYFFTLFKTNDGIMRALVRAGGPAWIAGLRTGDIVDKVDGKFWWEYGTYQTQLRAYDGRPHTFDVTRENRHDIHVALGEPYAG